jgi:hypothetical protein
VPSRDHEQATGLQDLAALQETRKQRAADEEIAAAVPSKVDDEGIDVRTLDAVEKVICELA